MAAREIEIAAGEDLVVGQEVLNEAGLGGRLRLFVQKGEIRILSEDMITPERVLEDLAGCLGQESVMDYDFQLKVGGFYEAR